MSDRNSTSTNQTPAGKPAEESKDKQAENAPAATPEAK